MPARSSATHAASPPRFADNTDPVEILDWVTRACPDAVLATALGPQSIAILELLHQLDRRVPVVFLDTHLHFPETYALRIRLQHRYKRTIQAIQPAQSLQQQQRDHGPELWRTHPDRCCALRKVAPLAATLAGRSAWITGLRRDASTTRARTRAVEWDATHALWKVNPLVAWTRPQVFAFLQAHEVPVNPLLSRGYTSVGCAPCTRPNPTGTDERAGRWADREKTECGIHHLYSETTEVAR